MQTTQPSAAREAFDAFTGWFSTYPPLATAFGIVVLLTVAWAADVIARRQLVRLLDLMIRRSTTRWDDVLHDNRVFQRLSHVVPAILIYFGVSGVPGVSVVWQERIQHVAAAVMVVIGMLAVSAFLSAINQLYERYEIARAHPIKGYLQVAKIILFVTGGVLALATLLDRDPLIFLSGVTAMTAVLLLIFRDTILSLVASVQIMGNDMIRVGDWVEIPKYNADGDVIDIALHTVKIRNWDNTISFVPTSKFIDDSFKNWRGMVESGARRIKRSVLIDQTTVRFLTDSEVERFKEMALLRDYMAERQRALCEYNRAQGVSDEDVDARRLTNIGTLRAYIVRYLQQHTKIHQDRTLLVRQLQATPNGLPLELYVFTNDTAWVRHEGIQSDIFDHILALVPHFGLRVFQNPTGADFRAAVGEEQPPFRIERRGEGSDA